MPWRIQIFTDGYYDYPEAIEHFYGRDIDYAQVICPKPSQQVSGK